MTRPITTLIALGAVSLSVATPAAAQLFKSGESGSRQLLPTAEEIALARSAAPAAVSDGASVYVLTGGGYELAVAGNNGAACYVSRDWTTSLEPHCFDAEGAATIMKIHMRKVELLHAGTTLEETSETVMDELLSGKFRLPRRPAMSWMMSSAQKLVGDGGRSVGAWKPHVMMYYPFLTPAELSLDGPPSMSSNTMISGGGGPLSTVVVVVPDFVDPVKVADSAP